MSAIFKRLQADERSQAHHVWSVVFSIDDTSIDQPGGHQDPWSDQDRIFGCIIDGKVVSCVHLMRRQTYVPDGVWTFGAIAGVATLEEYRGLGYSSQLMRMAGKQMQEDEVDLGLLLTGINPYYERFGWFTVPRRIMSANVVSAPSPGIELASAADWRELAPVYEAFNQGRPYSVVRAPEYWQGWANAWFRGANWLLIREGSKLVAYAAVRKTSTEVSVWEVAWLPDHPDAATALAQELMALSGVWKLPTVRGVLPDEPALWRRFEDAGATVSRFAGRGLMALPIRRSAEEIHALDHLFDEGIGTGVFWTADDF